MRRALNKMSCLVSTAAARARRAAQFESLEGRQYWYTPDMYVPLAGGGCGCTVCNGDAAAAQAAANDAAQTMEANGAGAQPLVAVDVMGPFASAAAAKAAAAEAAPAVTGLTLYNADTGQPIGPFENGTTLNYAALPPNLSVRAATAGSTGSVRFGVDANGDLHTENFAPFFIQGETSGGLPISWKPSNGTHTLKATAYGGSNGSGSVGSSMSVTFHVANAPTSAPVTSGTVVSFSDNSADIKEAGLDSGTLVFSRTGSTSSSLSISYNVSGTAGNALDYEQLSGMIVIPAGKNTASLTIKPKDDAIAEGTENIVLTINAGNGYSVGGPNTATVPVLDNDFGISPPPPSGQPGAVSDITWTRNGPRAPQPKTEAGAVQIGSKVYSIGGFTAAGGTGSFFPLTRRMQVYDMATRKWTELARIPDAAAGNHFGAATDGQNIYIVAGQTGHTYGVGTNTAWRYNVASNSWSKFRNLPEVRFGGSAFIVGNKLHFVGGNKADRTTITTDHWEIDLSNPSADWVRKASIPLGGDHMSHTTINGKVYLFGGEHDHHSLDPNDNPGYIQHNYTFEYNPANDTWTRKADMPIALSHIEGSTLAINGKAVLIGGLLTGGDENTTSRVHVYDPVANSWKTLSTRYPKRIIGATAGYWQGKIYMTEGYSPDEDDRQVGFEGTVKFA